MSIEALATSFVVFLAVYVGLGSLFGILFVARGLERIDPAARGASIGFRLIVLPGVVALWPLLARRWWSGVSTPPIERTEHRRTARPEARR